MARTTEAIVIGGSAGALEALDGMLPALPSRFSVPVVLVLHISPAKPSLLADVLGRKSALPVKEPNDKEPVASGAIYVAPPNYHLLFERSRTFSLSVDELVHFSRPSIDVAFESAADAYGAGLVGVLLSGANEDGARGLARVKAVGGRTFVQAPETASSPEMPEAALRLGAVDRVLSLAEIGPFLASLDDGPSPEGEGVG
ncbi:MAG: chemotaxis protein CheB [Labilithrix sp.]|nr:chemotaxis protein CheB [Labilithrix sp.]